MDLMSAVRRFAPVVEVAVIDLLRELPLLIGFAAIAYGAWLWFRPMGWIVGGMLLVLYRLLGVMAAVAAVRKPEPGEGA